MDATQSSRRTTWISCILAALFLYVVTWPIVEIKFARPHLTGSMVISRTTKSGADTYTTTQSAKGSITIHSGPTPMTPFTLGAPSSRIDLFETFYFPMHKLRDSKTGQRVIDPYYEWWLEALL